MLEIWFGYLVHTVVSALIGAAIAPSRGLRRRLGGLLGCVPCGIGLLYLVLRERTDTRPAVPPPGAPIIVRTYTGTSDAQIGEAFAADAPGVYTAGYAVRDRRWSDGSMTVTFERRPPGPPPKPGPYIGPGPFAATAALFAVAVLWCFMAVSYIGFWMMATGTPSRTVTDLYAGPAWVLVITLIVLGVQRFVGLEIMRLIALGAGWTLSGFACTFTAIGIQATTTTETMIISLVILAPLIATACLLTGTAFLARRG